MKNIWLRNIKMTRKLKNITDKQIINAVRNMCKELDIPGSISGDYNLYNSTLRELKRI
jgi:hypothetical protein